MEGLPGCRHACASRRREEVERRRGFELLGVAAEAVEQSGTRFESMQHLGERFGLASMLARAELLGATRVRSSGLVLRAGVAMWFSGNASAGRLFGGGYRGAF